MYNEELEMLIDAALADGELTEKEKQILFRKAQSLGVDLDEFNMVLEGRLQKTLANAKPKESGKRGTTKKCPHCGAIVTDFTATKCSECGYVFDDIKANTSMQQLTEKIVEIQQKHSNKISQQMSKSASANILTSAFSEQAEQRMSELRDKEIASAILTFPVSNSKSDLLEFISGAMAQIDFSDSGLVKNAWRGKWKECIGKAQMFYPNDTDFSPLIQQWQATQTTLNKFLVGWQGLSKKTRGAIIAVTCLVLFYAIVGLFFWIAP